MVKKSQAKPKIAKSLALAANAPKEYKLLNKVSDYDHDVVNEVVDAMNEIAVLQGRVQFLQNLVNDHKQYQKFIWKTLNGINIAFHNLEDDHLLNIIKHLQDQGRSISRELRNEAISRGFAVADTYKGNGTMELLEWQAAEQEYRNARDNRNW